MLSVARFFLASFPLLLAQACAGGAPHPETPETQQFQAFTNNEPYDGGLGKTEASTHTNKPHSTSSPSRPSGANTRPNSPTERPGLEVVRLLPNQQPTNKVDAVEPQDEHQDRVVVRAEGSREGQVFRDDSKPAQSSPAEAMQQYNEALELVQRKRYEQAIEAFAGFLVRYPGHPNADNAMYWRGECYYALGNYFRAAEQFEGVVARFPKGNKVPDALLKLGMSQTRMGETEQANNAYQRLRSEFPYSEAASKIPEN